MIPEIIATLQLLGAEPVVVTDGAYTRYEYQDSCRIEVVEYGDSTLVVETVCAPICSSRARVYDNKERLLHTITPMASAVFPYAYFDEKYQLKWIDNTPLMLDNEENKRRNTN